MTLGWIGAIGLVALALPEPADSPVAWSPESDWIAYTVRVHDLGHSLPTHWLFRTDSLNEDTADEADESAPRFRLWATRVDTKESVLLESGNGPLSAPSWSRDGKVLAFTRVVREDRGRARYEVVLQDDADHQRVILTQPLGNAPADLSAHAPAWSPDGRLLAVPLPQQTLDLAVLRADTGRILKVFPACTHPAWSPDLRNATLAFVRDSDPQMLQWVDSSFGAPRNLIELGRTTQAPLWLDASTVAAVAAVGARKGALPVPEQYLLIRVALETSTPQRIVALSGQPAEQRGTLRGGSFSFDRPRENLFFTRTTWSAPFEITWSRPRHNEILKPFSPYDYTLPSGALAVAPNDRLLAFRTGRMGSDAFPSIVDLTDDRLTPAALVPDDDVRVQWVATLAQTARRLLFIGLPPAKPKDGDEVERPSILPLPGELSAQNDMRPRLRYLSRVARPICDRPTDASPAEPAVQELLAQARLFFDYLREDYDAALVSLAEFEELVVKPDERLRLLSIRAQIYVAQGRAEQARETIEYLRERDRGQTERIEDTPLGPALRSLPAAGRGWPNYLAERAEAYLKAVQQPVPDAGPAHNPFGNRNLDAFEFGPFDAQVAPRRPRVFPFVAPPGDVPQVEGALDLVIPPGDNPPPPAQPGVRR